LAKPNRVGGNLHSAKHDIIERRTQSQSESESNARRWWYIIEHHFSLVCFCTNACSCTFSCQPLPDGWAHWRSYAAEPIPRFCTYSCTYRTCYAISHPCPDTVNRYRIFKHSCSFAAKLSVERRGYLSIDANRDDRWRNPAPTYYFSANSNCGCGCYFIDRSFNFDSRADRLCHAVAHTRHPSDLRRNDADSCTVERNCHFDGCIVERKHYFHSGIERSCFTLRGWWFRADSIRNAGGGAFERDRELPADDCTNRG